MSPTPWRSCASGATSRNAERAPRERPCNAASFHATPSGFKMGQRFLGVFRRAGEEAVGPFSREEVRRLEQPHTVSNYQANSIHNQFWLSGMKVKCFSGCFLVRTEISVEWKIPGDPRLIATYWHSEISWGIHPFDTIVGCIEIMTIRFPKGFTAYDFEIGACYGA
jgi:hypothetical protein